MVLVQALVAGASGYGLGVGGVAVFSNFVVGSNFRFLLLWQIPLVTGLMILLVCVVTALLSVRKVIKLEPAVVFKA